jgi:hypothetical protein
MKAIAHAMQSSDLRDRVHRIGDVDVLRALAGVSMRCMRFRPGKRTIDEPNPLGVAYAQAYFGAAGENAASVALIRDLRSELERVVATRQLGSASSSGIAHRIAFELIIDRCRHCQGRGVIPVVTHEVSEVAKERACPHCSGTGLPKVRHTSRRTAARVPPIEYTERTAGLYVAVMAEAGLAMADALTEFRRRMKLESREYSL